MATGCMLPPMPGGALWLALDVPVVTPLHALRLAVGPSGQRVPQSYSNCGGRPPLSIPLVGGCVAAVFFLAGIPCASHWGPLRQRHKLRRLEVSCSPDTVLQPMSPKPSRKSSQTCRMPGSADKCPKGSGAFFSYQQKHKREAFRFEGVRTGGAQGVYTRSTQTLSTRTTLYP